MIEQQGFYEFTIANEDVAMEAVKVSRNNIMWLIVSIQLSYIVSIKVYHVTSSQLDRLKCVTCRCIKLHKAYSAVR